MAKKSNRLVGVERLAMRLGQDHLSDYGVVTSRKDFTQRQIMTCLVLRAYLKTTYRGVIEILETSGASGCNSSLRGGLMRKASDSWSASSLAHYPH